FLGLPKYMPIPTKYLLSRNFLPRRRTEGGSKPGIQKNLFSCLTVSTPHKHPSNRYHRVANSLVAVVLYK
ncbi:hypothetical protein, partial [Prevotella multiformis]|uniref:hypothetical protein n=1 Tax=Prevotella multiformis TaxID=282402 RepID=UPI0028DC0A2B